MIIIFLAILALTREKHLLIIFMLKQSSLFDNEKTSVNVFFILKQGFVFFLVVANIK